MTASFPGVPSCGKFEVEWILKQMMDAPTTLGHDLVVAAAKHFGTCEDESLDWYRAAKAKFDEMQPLRDRQMIRDFLNVQFCPACAGSGGFQDHANQWNTCIHCGGLGESYDEKKLHLLLGLTVKSPRRKRS